MWWAGAVEAAGNAAVVTVLGWRIRLTWKTRWWSLLAFQVSAAIWFASNIGYAMMFMGSETGRWMWWDTWFDQTSETLQQLAIIVLPLAVLNLVRQLVKDYWTMARKLEGGA